MNLLPARRMSSLLVLMVTMMAGLVLAATPAAAAGVAPSAEFEMVSLINQARADAGLPRLVSNLQMLRLGRQWAGRMMAEGEVRHRPDLANAVDGEFQRLGENVGYTKVVGADHRAMARQLHRAFMDSATHRQHILGDFNQVGVGIVVTKDGQMWAAVNFIKGDYDAFPLYRDLVGSRHERAVARLFVRGIVNGCRSARFCPGRHVNRDQLAGMMRRAPQVRSGSQQLKELCGTNATCAETDVTRSEFAVVLAEALELDPIDGRRFSDVRSRDAGAVNAVVAAGVMNGCGDGAFCPDRPVRRAQVATYLNRALSL